MRYHFGPSVLRSRLLYRYTCKNVTGYDRVDIEMCQQNTFWNIDKKCSENNFMYSSYKKHMYPYVVYVIFAVVFIDTLLL